MARPSNQDQSTALELAAPQAVSLQATNINASAIPAGDDLKAQKTKAIAAAGAAKRKASKTASDAVFNAAFRAETARLEAEESTLAQRSADQEAFEAMKEQALVDAITGMSDQDILSHVDAGDFQEEVARRSAVIITERFNQAKLSGGLPTLYLPESAE